VIDPFIPTAAQQDQLSDEDYAALAIITLALLQRVEQSIIFPTEAEIDNFTAEYRASMERTMLPPTEALLAGDVPVAEWERDIADAVVAAVLLGLLLAVGGVDGLRSQFSPRGILQFSKASLVGDLRAVRHNARRIAGGELTPGQILAGLKRRSQSFRGSYERTKHSVLIASGVANEGRRFLTSPHPCPNCPDYEQRDWVSLTEIIPVATLCVCQSHCKCRVETRFNPQRALEELSGGSFSDRIQRAAAFQSETESRWRSTWEH
jgi:hypothetical protein